MHTSNPNLPFHHRADLDNDDLMALQVEVEILSHVKKTKKIGLSKKLKLPFLGLTLSAYTSIGRPSQYRQAKGGLGRH